MVYFKRLHCENGRNLNFLVNFSYQVKDEGGGGGGDCQGGFVGV